MIVIDHLNSAFGEIRANMFRSVLTTLGIVIAVMAVISVVSILEGMSRYIKGFIKGMGSDAMWVLPYFPPGRAESSARVELTYDDAMAIQSSCPQIKRVSPMIQSHVDMIHLDADVSVPMLGTTPEFQEIRNWFVDSGRYFSNIDTDHRKHVCVLGREVLKKIGADESILGAKIKIDNRTFKVIGLLERKGSFFGQSQDEIVLIPFATAEKIYGPRVARRINILAQVHRSEAAAETVEQIRDLLRKRHKLRDAQADDFQISTQDQVLEFFNKASRITTVVLAGIVGISLLVGGIGIMNIMLVSVTERTREIGVLKALGARPKDILFQFLIEAVILSLLGGVIGIILGMAVGMGVAALSPLPSAYIPLWAVGLSFLFSGGVGIFFGMYPAVKAARLNPIDALRWE